MSTFQQAEFHPDTYRVSADQPLGDLYVRSIRNAEQSGTPVRQRAATSDAERTRAREVRRLVDRRTYGPGSHMPAIPDEPEPPVCGRCGAADHIRPTRHLWPREGAPIPLAWRCVGSCGGQRSEATDRIRAGELDRVGAGRHRRHRADQDRRGVSAERRHSGRDQARD